MSTGMQAQLLLEQMRGNTLKMFTYQQQLSTGQRLLAPSDDPSAAGRALRLSDVLERYGQLQRNTASAARFVASTENALSDVRNLLNEASSLASQNVGVTSDPEQRSAAAAIVDGLISQLVSLANRQHEGLYLFAGQRLDRPPFVEALGGVLYQGDTGDLRVNVDGQTPLAMNVSGDKVFGSLSAQVRGWVDLDPAVSAETRLADLRGYGGRGIRPGSIVIDDVGGVGAFTVDLAGASTLGDVVDAIDAASAAAGATIDASLTATGIQLTAAAGHSIGVSEQDDGQTASDLGLLRPAPVATPLAGYDLDPKVTLSTPLALLRGGAGIDQTSGFVVSNGGKTAVVDLSAAKTVQDLLNAVNGLDMGVLARISEDGRSIDIVSRLSGSSLSIGENGGTTATTLGIQSFHAGTRLADLNGGRGVGMADGSDLRIVASNGASFEVDLAGAETIGDVLAAINAAAAAAGVAVSATTAVVGNGIRLVDATGGADTLRIERVNLSPAIDDLGLNTPAAGNEIVGADVHAIAPDGLFSTLAQLREALLANDTAGITRAGGWLHELGLELGKWQGRIGALARSIEGHEAQLEDASLATRSLLSEAKDADFTEAITLFTQAQTILQANLMTGSRVMQLSLLDFLQ